MGNRKTADPYGFKARLERLGLYQQSAADELGWSASAFSRFLSGETDPPLSKVDRLEQWLQNAEQAPGVVRKFEAVGLVSPATGSSNCQPPSGRSAMSYQERSEHLRRRMEALGFRQDEAAAELKWSVHKVHRLLAGKLKRLREITMQLELFEEWVSKLERERGLSELSVADWSSGRLEPRLQSTIDLVRLIGGGLQPDQVIFHEVTSFDHEPRYFAGELAVAIKGKWPRPGEDCLVEENSGFRLRRYENQRDGSVNLRTFDKKNFESCNVASVQLHRVFGRLTF